MALRRDAEGAAGMDAAAGVNGARPAEPSTGELVQHASEQLSRLTRHEIALARAELKDKGRHAGVGVGLFGGSGLISLYAVGALVLAAIAGLAEAVPAWLAALIVGVALLLVAGVMGLLGRRHVRRAMPLMPEAATRGVKADMAAVKTAVRDRGRS